MYQLLLSGYCSGKNEKWQIKVLDNSIILAYSKKQVFLKSSELWKKNKHWIIEIDSIVLKDTPGLSFNEAEILADRFAQRR